MTWWNEVAEVVSMLINTAALVYGAITDYRHRLISDLVPVTLIGTGIVKICQGAVWWPKVIAMLVVGTIVFVQIRPDDDNPPGGDFKLLSAMAFSDGLLTVLAVLLLTGLAATIHGLLHKQPMQRHIPLCTYAAPAYLAACTVQIIFFGGTL